MPRVIFEGPVTPQGYGPPFFPTGDKLSRIPIVTVEAIDGEPQAEIEWVGLTCVFIRVKGTGSIKVTATGDPLLDAAT